MDCDAQAGSWRWSAPIGWCNLRVSAWSFFGLSGRCSWALVARLPATRTEADDSDSYESTGATVGEEDRGVVRLLSVQEEVVLGDVTLTQILKRSPGFALRVDLGANSCRNGDNSRKIYTRYPNPLFHHHQTCQKNS